VTWAGFMCSLSNAGINYDTHRHAETVPMQEVQQTLDTNLLGAWRMAQAFIPYMQQQGYGRIVNVSSGAGALTGMGAGTPAYSVSKAAMNAMTIKLGHELKQHGILVNAVCPGWVQTDMGGANAPRTVQQGAQSVVWAATIPNSGPAAGFFRDGQPIAW